MNHNNVRTLHPGRPHQPGLATSEWTRSTTPARETPLREREPLFMKRWKYLWRNELVELRRGTRVVGTGYVDDSTEDAGIIWINLTHGRGRVLIHHDDGIDIWRVDPRV
jgi:hypothetical protein